MKKQLKKELVYLASPYSKYPGGKSIAFTEVCDMAAHLMHKGYNVFCPIAHSHAIETMSFKEIENGDWWLEQDFAILSKCDKLFVYQMPSWDISYGVNAEIDFAKKNRIPIEYLAYDESFKRKATATG